LTYADGAPFPGVIGRTAEESSPAWPTPPQAAEERRMFSSSFSMTLVSGSCRASVVWSRTPVLDGLAANGLRYNNMHTTALCSPSRGCIVTGRNHHSLGLATIAETSTGYPGYNAILPFDKGMLSEMLLPHGYNTFLVGKWHLSPPEHETPAGPYDRWPLGRGFERSTASSAATRISGIPSSSTTTIPSSSPISRGRLPPEQRPGRQGE
jgi:arylsulfatase